MTRCHHSARPPPRRGRSSRAGAGGDGCAGGRQRRGLDDLAEQFGGEPDERAPQDTAGRRIDRHVVGHGHHHAPGGLGRAGTGGRVLDRHARHRVDAERRGGPPVGLGMGLAVGHHVAGDHRLEGARREVQQHLVGDVLPRHGHHRARHAGGVERVEQFACAGAPRHVAADARQHRGGEVVDDLLRLDRQSGAPLDHRGGVQQVEPDDRHGVVVGPHAAEGAHELVLALHPVRLGVDQRAVEVPQDGRRERAHEGGGPGSWTSSISVPKLPFGWTKATVVPRLPGRGASSITVAPAARIEARASAQSATR